MTRGRLLSILGLGVPLLLVSPLAVTFTSSESNNTGDRFDFGTITPGVCLIP